MTDSTNSTEAGRTELIDRINRRLDELQPVWPHFPMEDARAAVAGYSGELLQHVLRIFSTSNDLVSIQLINRICMPEVREYLIPTAKLHEQVAALPSYAGKQLRTNDLMDFLRSLRHYDDERIPPCPQPDEPISPVHIALYVITETADTLHSDHGFNFIREEILKWVEPGMYRIVDESLLLRLTTNPYSAERISKLALALKTLHLYELEPFLHLMELHPNDEDRIIDLIATGATRPAQTEALLIGNSTPAVSNGIL